MDCSHDHLQKWETSRDEHERELYQVTLRKDRMVEVSPDTWPPFERTDTILMCSDIRRLRYVYGHDSCQLTTMLDGLPHPPLPTYIAIAKGLDALRKDLNIALMHFSESGQVQRLKKRWLTGNRFTCDTTAEFKPLSFSNLMAMLLIVPLAVGFSLIILVLECIWHRNREVLAQKFASVCQVSGTGG